MTKEKIRQLIDEKKKELSANQKGHNYYYAKDYWEHHQVIKVSGLLEIDIWQYLACVYGISCGVRITDVKEKFKEFTDFFDDSSSKLIQELISITLDFLDDGKLDQIITYLKENNKAKSSLLLKRIYPEDDDYTSFIKSTKCYVDVEGLDMTSYFELYQHNAEAMMDCMLLYSAFRDMEENKAKIEEAAADLEGVSQKRKDRVFKGLVKKRYKLQYMHQILNIIPSYIQKLEDQEKNNKIEISKLDQAFELLEKKSHSEEIDNAREITKLIRDESIKLAVLKYIYEHNSKYYRRLEEELVKLNENSKARYQALLSDFRIAKDSCSVEAIMHNSVEEVRVMLKTLKGFGMTSEKILKVLKNSDVNTVLTVKDYINKGFLSIDFLNSNIDFFYTNSEKISIYQKNICILKKYNINPSLFNNCIYVLLEDGKILDLNLSILVDYDLLKSLRTTNNYQFLLDENLLFKIDSLLSLGYEEHLKENIDLLSSSNIKRLKVLKGLGITEIEMDQLKKILNERFFISDEELDLYIENVIPYKEKQELDFSIESLEEYKISPRVYNLNGVFISVNKVKRALKCGKCCYDAIFENSSLTEEEYEKVMEILKPYSKKKKSQ